MQPDFTEAMTTMVHSLKAMLRVLLLALVLPAALPALAATHGGAEAARQQLVSSALVAGKIVIGTDGAVESHTLDEGVVLEPAMVEFLDRAIAQWRFEPVKVDGQAVRAQVPMRLRLVLRPVEGDRFKLEIASTYFGSAHSGSDEVQSKRLAPPRYPWGALRAGGQGTVYLVLQVGRDGKVMHVAAEQVNLRSLGTAQQMQDLRQVLAQAATKAATRWTFTPPTTGEDAADESWLVRVPVSFEMGRDRRHPNKDEGGWETYLPGPRNILPPWAQEATRLAGNPDALPDTGVFMLQGSGPRLLNSPAG